MHAKKQMGKAAHAKINGDAPIVCWFNVLAMVHKTLSIAHLCVGNNLCPFTDHLHSYKKDLKKFIHSVARVDSLLTG